jgi:hypothetical protein
MKKYTVYLPMIGTYRMDVDANSNEDAINKAIDSKGSNYKLIEATCAKEIAIAVGPAFKVKTANAVEVVKVKKVDMRSLESWDGK